MSREWHSIPAEEKKTIELWWKEGYRAALRRQHMGHIQDPELSSLVNDAWKEYDK